MTVLQRTRPGHPVAAVVGLWLMAGSAIAQQAGGAGADLAVQLANPVANLISVPMKVNWDTGIGPADANRTTLVVQPVIPFSFNDKWNLITRTIVPLIRAESPVAGGPTESGLGDTTQSFFFSPNAPTAGGWIWAAGPVGFYPTASNSALGRKKWGLGPSVLLLSQANGWSYGALANHIWSVAGNDDRPDLSETFLQPFVSYTSPSATGISLNTESIYDWKSDQWTVPINLGVSQLVKFGAQPVSFQLIARKYVERPAGGPEWGLSFTVTLLFPK